MPFASFPLLDQNLLVHASRRSRAWTRSRGRCRSPSSPERLVTQEDGQNVTVKPPRQNPGAREVIGILDAADASRFLLPTASLENAGGAFVAPATSSFLAGIAHATVNPDGVTRSVDLTSKDRAIYPLTILISAAPLDHGGQGHPAADGRLPRLRRRSRAGPGRRGRQAAGRSRAAADRRCGPRSVRRAPPCSPGRRRSRPTARPASPVGRADAGDRGLPTSLPGSPRSAGSRATSPARMRRRAPEPTRQRRPRRRRGRRPRQTRPRR